MQTLHDAIFCNLYGPSVAAQFNKNQFHRIAKTRLQRLAHELGLAAGSYEIRSNKGGMAVSGEITLHADTFYIQVSKSCMGRDADVLYRSCKGRGDYTGGRNHFIAAAALDDPRLFAQLLRRHQEFGLQSLPA